MLYKSNKKNKTPDTQPSDLHYCGAHFQALAVTGLSPNRILDYGKDRDEKYRQISSKAIGVSPQQCAKCAKIPVR